MKIAILDDYASAALTLADWSPVTRQADVHVFNRHLSDAEIVAALEPFEVICTLRERASLPALVLDRLPHLKAIVVTDARVRTIDYAAAARNGVVILEGKAPADLPSAPAATAEFAWGLILATVRHIPAEAQRLREGLWQKSLGMPLEGKTLGIVGLGKIGARVARYARAFDMQVLAIRRDVARSAADALDLLGGMEIFDEVLRRADYLLLALPLTPATRGLIGEAQLGLMKPTAMLVNVSRGEIVDELALYQALAGRRLAGAALDVWYRYPTDAAPTLPARQPFHELPNVLMTPHVSGWTEGMLEARARLIAENIARTARGEPPLNLIPPAV